jgi:hypothetical protein
MNYYKLNLPKNPLRNTFTLKLNGDEFWHIYRDVENVLNDEVLSTLQILNLVPLQILIFGSTVKSRKTGLLHADMGWDGTKWKSVSCGINWELKDTISTIQWHDVSKHCIEVKPYIGVTPYNVPYPHNYSQAIVYNLVKPQPNLVVYDDEIVHLGETLDGKSTGVSHPPGWVFANEIENPETLLESITLEQNDYPILFNTSKPHAVLYENKDSVRFSMSVRFDVDRFKSWEEAVDSFSTIIYNT